jgi:hypothetical protein
MEGRDMTKLSATQEQVLAAAALKRFSVEFGHYMGSFQPNEFVSIYDGKNGVHRYRPSTVAALADRGFVRFKHTGPGASEIKVTKSGLDYYMDNLRPRVRDLIAEIKER